jgi:LmbE family N-acetylglucosaminyl deacetylase
LEKLALLQVTKPLPTINTTLPQVCAIIPAYNEAEHVGHLLEVLKNVESVAQILVIDDGSQDGTGETALRAAREDGRVRVLRHPQNLGKGQAILTGCQAASAPILLFLDADLASLTPAHIAALVSPVQWGESDMTVGILRSGIWKADISHKTTPWLSGQRCLRADLLPQVCAESAQGYGLETALTVAARRQNWRCQEVLLTGLSTSPGTLYRGLWGRVGRKLRMLGDIGKAMHRNRAWHYFFPRIRPEARLLLIVLLLLLASTLAFNRSRAAGPLSAADLPILDLTEVFRILVVSPHPDDEVLGAGGLIQMALAQGAQVKVVMLTNGDGQVFVPVALNRGVRAGLRDFVAYGEYRQTETLDALATLGVPAEDVFFLGYPDRSLLNLWSGDWEQDCPVRSAFTRTAHTPYKNSYNPLARYCGSDLMADIRQIIEGFLPDLVVIPHPNDDHPDHRAAGNFTRLALSLVQQDIPDYTAGLVSYLVHYGPYPQPRGHHYRSALVPPAALSGSHNTWFRLDLPPQAVRTKLAALNRYPTQLRLLGKFLPSFARPNELFMALSSSRVNPLEYTVVPLHEVEAPQVDIAALPEFSYPSLPEPVREGTSQMLLAGADLVGWRIARLGSHLVLTVDTRGPLIPGLQYRILVKTPDGSTHIFRYTEPKYAPFQSSFTARIDLAEFGRPPVLAFSADVQQGLTLERTGWYFIELNDWLP